MIINTSEMAVRRISVYKKHNHKEVLYADFSFYFFRLARISSLNIKSVLVQQLF